MPAGNLAEVVEFLSGRRAIEPMAIDAAAVFRQSHEYPFDFKDIRGQEQAKRPGGGGGGFA